MVFIACLVTSGSAPPVPAAWIPPVPVSALPAGTVKIDAGCGRWWASPDVVFPLSDSCPKFHLLVEMRAGSKVLQGCGLHTTNARSCSASASY